MLGYARARIAALVGVSVLGLAACGGRDDGLGDTTVGMAGGDVAARADTAAAAMTPAPPGTMGPMTITGGNDEVVMVMATIDQAEVEAGQLAQETAQDAQVKRFARTLVTEHSRSMRKLGDVARAAGMPGTGGAGATTQSNVVNRLQAMHAQTMTQLRSADGAAFDSAFVTAQVQAHQQALDLLQQARSQATHAQLQQHVSESIAGIETHLERARQLQQNLAGATTGSDTSTRKGTRSDTGRRG